MFDINNRQLPDEKRVTKIGKIIRATSLDEILQLLNVIKGDMSLVGPRPLMMQYLTRYTSEQAKRHDVKPGITGLAQVNGRNAISWEQKFQYDIIYVVNQSFFLDIKILWKTFIKVIRRKDINFNSNVTIQEFMG
jgi:lipopolysaccharide/colanic/teichoic acid biosynthesis glycosyltransferase